MGLEDFNVAPDNKGGRPKGSTTEEPDNAGLGPSHEEYSSEEYWKSLLNETWNGEELTFDAMEEMCHETHMLPQSILSKLMDNGVIEKHELGEYLEMHRSKQKESTAPWETERKDSGGLSSIIDAAK